MSNERQTERLKRVGALWKPRAGAKSFGSGEVTVDGKKQRFVILKNDRKVEGSRQPDYLLMSSEVSKLDERARGQQVRDAEQTDDDEIPF